MRWKENEGQNEREFHGCGGGKTAIVLHNSERFEILTMGIKRKLMNFLDKSVKLLTIKGTRSKIA
jgi:hypothetical protein